MRTCRKCLNERDLTDFRPNRRVCKGCERKFDQELYWREPAKRRQNTKAHRDRKRLYIQEQKSDPCLDCGISYPPAIMNFHHRDPSEKLFNLSHAVTMSEARIDAEIAKCDLLCPNCHALRHLNEQKPAEAG